MEHTILNARNSRTHGFSDIMKNYDVHDSPKPTSMKISKLDQVTSDKLTSSDHCTQRYFKYVHHAGPKVVSLIYSIGSWVFEATAEKQAVAFYRERIAIAIKKKSLQCLRHLISFEGAGRAFMSPKQR